MAHRPDLSQFDRSLTVAQFHELHHKLAMLSPHHVQEAYWTANKACRMDGDGLPRAAAIQQELVVGPFEK
jgi:hypothetical protein